MIREKIIQTANLLYARYGIKSVSMNQISAAMGISKKTIYAEFENKEHLLLECIDYNKRQLDKVITKIEQESNSSLEILLLASADVFYYASSYCPAFYKDARRFPDISERLMAQLAGFRVKCEQYFQNGVKESLFLPEIDYEIISSVFIEQLQEMRVEYQSTIILTFLRGVSTQKGIEELEKYLPATKKNNQTINF